MTLTVGTDTYLSMSAAYDYNDKLGQTAWTEYRKTISAIVTHTDGILITFLEDHGMVADDVVFLQDTTSYNGNATAVTVVGTKQITVNKTYVADESEGYGSLLADYTAREIALRIATQWLDLTYGPRMLSYPSLVTQALLNPRQDLYNSRGEVVESDVIAESVEDSTAEMALVILNDESIYQNDSSDDALQKIYEKIGPIVTKWRVNEDKVGVQPVFAKVARLMSPILSPDTVGMSHVVRT